LKSDLSDLPQSFDFDKKRRITDFLIAERPQPFRPELSAKSLPSDTKDSEKNASKGNAEEAHRLRNVMGIRNGKFVSEAFKFGFQNEASETSLPSDKSLAVFVGGMPYAWGEDDVHAFWSECGEIEEVDCFKFRDSGRFKGMAKIVYATEEGCNAALACNEETWEDCTFSVTKWNGKERGEKLLKRVAPSDNPIGQKVEGFDVLFLCNLPLSMTETEISSKGSTSKR